MSNLVTALGILFWMGVGAAIGVGAMGVLVAGKYDDDHLYAPYAELLGKKCWVDRQHEWYPHRIVAVSHKGAINVRPWDDTSGKHAFWIRPNQIKRGLVAFREEDCA